MGTIMTHIRESFPADNQGRRTDADTGSPATSGNGKRKLLAEEHGPKKAMRNHKYPIGTTVFKHFAAPPFWFEGTVVEHSAFGHRILYTDNDQEDLDEQEMEQFAVPPGMESSYRLVPKVFDPFLMDDNLSSDCLWALHGIQKKTHCKSLPMGTAEFFLFMSERQRIYVRRKRGDRPPWSANKLFQDHTWCNVYRELDAGTQYFHNHILTLVRDETFTRKVLFLSYLYRQVNRVESFERTGFPDEEGLDQFFAVMFEMKKNNQSFFSDAHQTTSHSQLKIRLTDSLVQLDKIAEGIQKANARQEVLKLLQELPGVGDFTSWQILCDLQESGCIDIDDNFCLLGPGAKEGLKIIFGKLPKNEQLKKARELVKDQDLVYEKLGVQFPYWRGRKLTIKEIEHALCEFAKFKNGKALRRFRMSRNIENLCDLCGQRSCQCAN